PRRRFRPVPGHHPAGPGRPGGAGLPPARHRPAPGIDRPPRPATRAVRGHADPRRPTLRSLPGPRPRGYNALWLLDRFSPFTQTLALLLRSARAALSFL